MVATLVRLVPVALLIATGVLAAAPSREELLRTTKHVEGKPPRYESFTAEAARDAVKVVSRRNYAGYGFNDSAVMVRLPAATNSIYAVVEFDEPKLTDARGRKVPFELEQGIFDFDRSSTEVRVKKVGGEGVVDFARATGKLKVKYPLSVATTSLKKGSGSKDLKIDGPFVSYNSGLELPKESTFIKILPVRAYDATGKELQRAGSGRSSSEGDVWWYTIPFWGNVAEVRIDRIEKWGEIAVDYDLPPAPKWPASQQGLVPSAEEQAKMEIPGAKVTKKIVPQP